MKVKKNNKQVQTIKTNKLVVSKHAQKRCEERKIDVEELKEALSKMTVEAISINGGINQCLVETEINGKGVEVCLGMTKGKKPKYVIVSSWMKNKEGHRDEIKEIHTNWRRYKEEKINNIKTKETMEEYKVNGCELCF